MRTPESLSDVSSDEVGWLEHWASVALLLLPVLIGAPLYLAAL